MSYKAIDFIGGVNYTRNVDSSTSGNIMYIFFWTNKKVGDFNIHQKPRMRALKGRNEKLESLMLVFILIVIQDWKCIAVWFNGKKVCYGNC